MAKKREVARLEITTTISPNVIGILTGPVDSVIARLEEYMTEYQKDGAKLHLVEEYAPTDYDCVHNIPTIQLIKIKPETDEQYSNRVEFLKETRKKHLGKEKQDRMDMYLRLKKEFEGKTT